MRIIYTEELIKKGATAATYVGAHREIVYDQASNSLYYHDGSTVGGILIGSGGAATGPIWNLQYVTAMATAGVRSQCIVQLAAASGSLTVMAPPAAAAMDQFRVYAIGVISGSKMAQIDFTGSALNGKPSELFVLDTDFGNVEFTYIDATIGWIISTMGVMQF